MTEREVIRRRARATGTEVVLVYAPSADPDQPWETICVDHGGVCSHETRKVAEGWLSHPSGARTVCTAREPSPERTTNWRNDEHD